MSKELAAGPIAPDDSPAKGLGDKEQMDMERGLEQTLLEYKAILENAFVGIMCTRDRRVLHCNPRFSEIFGWPHGELIGQSGSVLYESEEAYLDIGRIAAPVLGAGKLFDAELRMARKDGASFLCHLLGKAIDPRRTQAGTIWIAQDVTARKEAELVLVRAKSDLEERVRERTSELIAAHGEVEEQLHFLRQLLDAIPNPVFYKDQFGQYLECNAAWEAFVGVPRAEIKGKSDAELFPPEVAAITVIEDLALLASPGSRSHEWRMVSAGGSVHDVLLSKATFKRQDGTIGGLVGVIIDISERKRLETRLRQAATVFESTGEGVTIVDRDGRIVAVNKAFTAITGYAEDEVLGKNPRVLKSGRHETDFYEALWQSVLHAGTWQGEVWNRRKSGDIYPQWLTISEVRDDAGSVTHYVGVFSDITSLKRTQEKLDYQAHHDPLTDLPNRLLFEDRLFHALQRARRDKSILAVMFVDLDRFKNINDTLGHPVGDAVLCAIGKRLSGALRDVDTVARLGGDEFIILLEGIEDARAVSVVAEKLLDDFGRPIAAAGQDFYVTSSIGISLYPRDGEDVAPLVKNADAAMYRAKERGRNSYDFYTVELTSTALERLSLETHLRKALERNELRLFLQPQFSIATGRLTGAEALVRWMHPEKGLVSPASFIALAEESGLIIPVGEWVLREACQQARRWRDAGLCLPRVAVNVSAMQFRRGRILEAVTRILEDTGLPAEYLELEITENYIMKQAEDGINVLVGLRNLGVRLAIDDFGTGYSSLSYLKRLPVDNLKIDQGFVRDLPEDSDDAAIARAVIALAHSMDLGVIAEGVENEAQQAFLRAEGCDEVQGFLLGMPIPAHEFARVFEPPPQFAH